MFANNPNRFLLWMADGGAAAGESAPKKVRGPFRKVFLDELAEAEKVALAAQNEPYRSLLENNWAIAPAEVAAQLQLITNTRNTLLGAQSAHSQSGVTTEQKDTAEADIIAAIRRIQAGARRTHDGNPTQLKRFFVGADLDANEEDLDGIADAILKILETETLIGVGPTQIQALQTALTNWDQYDEDQSSQDAAGVGGNAEVKLAMPEVKKGRRAIQIAIDGEFPAPTKAHPNANAQVRETFDLPKYHPFK